jgi:hypothetical protein
MSFVLIELPRPFRSTHSRLPAVSADLNYLTPSPERPVNYATEPPPGVPRRGGRADRRTVRIRDARHLAQPASLDHEGFALAEWPSRVRDFTDERAVRAVYYGEIERLLKLETGADHVVVFDHTLRRDARDGEQADGVREPVRFVHNDYTDVSGRRRVSDHLEPLEAARRLERRHAVINVWRPIGGPVRQAPLAVCDARSIASEDLIPTDLVYSDRVGEVYSVHFNPQHRWYWYPQLRPGEVLLLKTYDSLDDGTARFAPHAAFDDPTAPSDAPPRASIEVRALVFFAEPRPVWHADLFSRRRAIHSLTASA